MSQWGIPDWTDPVAYGDPTAWTKNRWRWEFTRRREDFRSDFEAVVEDTVRHWKEVYSGEWAKAAGIDPDGLLGPNDPGFVGRTTVVQLLKYGTQLLNPRIGEQPSHALLFQPNLSRQEVKEGGGEPLDEQEQISIPDGALAVVFDLDRPIEDQIVRLRETLIYYQLKRHGKKIQWRQRPEKWFTYLRVLDGREAGATWREIFETVLSREKHANLNPEQEARNVWQQARELMFNWRG